jgi:hypothetical protein
MVRYLFILTVLAFASTLVSAQKSGNADLLANNRRLEYSIVMDNETYAFYVDCRKSKGEITLSYSLRAQTKILSGVEMLTQISDYKKDVVAIPGFMGDTDTSGYFLLPLAFQKLLAAGESSDSIPLLVNQTKFMVYPSGQDGYTFEDGGESVVTYVNAHYATLRLPSFPEINGGIVLCANPLSPVILSLYYDGGDAGPSFDMVLMKVTTIK